MKFRKCLKHAFNMVVNSRLRSWLTIIGIVIGVASVIAIIGVGDGMEEKINNQLGSLGADLITITPGFSKAMRMGPPGRGSSSSVLSSENNPLTKRDVQVLKTISNIKLVETQISGNADVYYLSKEGSLLVKGVDQKVWSDLTTDEIEEGRMLDSADYNVIIIGHSLANDYFDRKLGINKALTIEGKAFRVIGILEEGTRNSIYMPLSAAYDILEDKVNDEYDKIIVKVKNEDLVEETVEEIEKKLRIFRHVDEKTQDFTVSSTQQIMSTVNDMTSTMTSFLAAIAAISLLVGAVGIANTMFTSVLERTKQIGIMKAIGAKNNDILIIFILNSAIIGLIGGILGVVLGYVAATFLSMVGMTSIIGYDVVALALGVSIVVGMLSGLLPAYQASQQNPVDALRNE